MNLIEWILLFLISTPLVLLGLDAFLKKVRSPRYLASHFEEIDAYVTRKIVSKNSELETQKNSPGSDELPYLVEVIIDEEKIVFNDRDLFQSVKVGNIVDLTLEHKRFMQKSLLQNKYVFTTEVKSFLIRA